MPGRPSPWQLTSTYKIVNFFAGDKKGRGVLGGPQNQLEHIIPANNIEHNINSSKYHLIV